jgi:diadenosine tetraphosphate (Ap4A) HIT family hydrolase
MNACPLCAAPTEIVLWRNDLCRVIAADEADYPGFLRVVVHDHVKEMTDLAPSDQIGLMRVVFAAEAALREVMQPSKINLASLGNVVPHLHWHVIPRFADDPHFPNPVWGARQRDTPRATPSNLDALLHDALSRQLAPAPETE